jgi:hypothetical protein
MASEFIEQLPLSEEEKGQLRSLGADSPAALLALIDAARESFERFFGLEKTDSLRRTLQGIMASGEHLPSGPVPKYALGAMLEPLPNIPVHSCFNTAVRDQLYREWTELQKNPATRNGPRAQELERRLTALVQDNG